MPESAEEIYARVVSLVGVEGRLPMPPVGDWDIFPWELVDGELQPKVVQPPQDVEEPRRGVVVEECWCSKGVPSNAIWRNDRWCVTSWDKPSGMPLMLFLQPLEHIDMDEMDDELASEFGRITNWLHRIMAHLPNVGRVHVNRWGDGGHHMHVWFTARTDRLPGILGSMAIEWNEMLPPGDEATWRKDLAHVAYRLANHDGTALV